MKIVYTDGFIKSIPKNKDERNNLEKRLKNLDVRYRDCDEGYMSLFTKGERSKELAGDKGHFTLRLNNSDRIHYTSGKYLNSHPGIENDDIILLSYLKHDDISRTVKNHISVPLSEEIITMGFNACEVLDEPLPKIDIKQTKVYYCSIEKEDLTFVPCLSRKQLECLEINGASFIIGGAGSGKTLVMMNKLCKANITDNEKAAYLTISDSLVRYCREESSKISADFTKKEFFTLNDYCIKALKINAKDVFNFTKFKNWRKNKNCLAEISVDEIWAEIRGCIKGYMGKEWRRTYSFPFDAVSDDKSKKYLIEKKAIVEINHRTLKNLLNDNQKSKLIRDINSDQSEKNKNKLIDYINKTFDLSNRFSFDAMHRLLDFDQYMELSEEFSPYTKEQRKHLYEIASAYQEHLNYNGMVDDNDLAGMLIEKILNESFCEKFEYLFVDEVQDLTELQIFLTTKLVKSIINITYAGDIHQVINPTYFDNNRLEGLYVLSGEHLTVLELDTNFRSGATIIKLANELAQLRRTKIAKKKDATEQDLEGVENIDIEEDVYKLKITKENIDRLMNVFVDNADVVLLVADENEKKRIKSDYAINDDIDIFTVVEFKGLESEYVVCFDITSAYANQWQNIFNNLAIKHSRFRYYFNLFYVAITRAKTKICLCESKNVFENYPKIAKLFTEEEIFDEEKLGLFEPSSLSDWYESADYYEKKEKYDTAIRRFKKAKAAGNEVLRCKAKKMWQENKFEEAFELLLDIKENALAKDVANQCGDEKMNCVLDIVVNRITFKIIDTKYNAEIVAKTFICYQKQRTQINELYFKPKTSYFIKNVISADKIISEGL